MSCLSACLFLLTFTFLTRFVVSFKHEIIPIGKSSFNKSHSLSSDVLQRLYRVHKGGFGNLVPEPTDVYELTTTATTSEPSSPRHSQASPREFFPRRPAFHSESMKDEDEDHDDHDEEPRSFRTHRNVKVVKKFHKSRFPSSPRETPTTEKPGFSPRLPSDKLQKFTQELDQFSFKPFVPPTQTPQYVSKSESYDYDNRFPPRNGDQETRGEVLPPIAKPYPQRAPNTSPRPYLILHKAARPQSELTATRTISSLDHFHRDVPKPVTSAHGIPSVPLLNHESYEGRRPGHSTSYYSAHIDHNGGTHVIQHEPESWEKPQISTPEIFKNHGPSPQVDEPKMRFQEIHGLGNTKDNRYEDSRKEDDKGYGEDQRSEGKEFGEEKNSQGKGYEGNRNQGGQWTGFKNERNPEPQEDRHQKKAQKHHFSRGQQTENKHHIEKLEDKPRFGQRGLPSTENDVQNKNAESDERNNYSDEENGQDSNDKEYKQDSNDKEYKQESYDKDPTPPSRENHNQGTSKSKLKPMPQTDWPNTFDPPSQNEKNESSSSEHTGTGSSEEDDEKHQLIFVTQGESTKKYKVERRPGAKQIIHIHIHKTEHVEGDGEENSESTASSNLNPDITLKAGEEGKEIKPGSEFQGVPDFNRNWGKMDLVTIAHK